MNICKHPLIGLRREYILTYPLELTSSEDFSRHNDSIHNLFIALFMFYVFLINESERSFVCVCSFLISCFKWWLKLSDGETSVDSIFQKVYS